METGVRECGLYIGIVKGTITVLSYAANSISCAGKLIKFSFIY